MPHALRRPRRPELPHARRRWLDHPLTLALIALAAAMVLKALGPGLTMLAPVALARV